VKLDIAAIEQQLWPTGGNRNVYMILDGARHRRIYSDLMNSHLIYSCLYSGDLPFELEVAAPQLGKFLGRFPEVRYSIGKIAASPSDVSSRQNVAWPESCISLLRSKNPARLPPDLHER
jgi:hypothetical protein